MKEVQEERQRGRGGRTMLSHRLDMKLKERKDRKEN